MSGYIKYIHLENVLLALPKVTTNFLASHQTNPCKGLMRSLSFTAATRWLECLGVTPRDTKHVSMRAQDTLCCARSHESARFRRWHQAMRASTFQCRYMKGSAFQFGVLA